MNKVLNVALGLTIALSGLSNVVADEVSIKKAIEAAYPKVKVESVKKTIYAGLYEVYLGGQILYTDEKFSFLIADGHLVDSKTKKDVTAERLQDLNRIDFSKLPLDLAIKVVKGDGSRKLAVFSDVDCPFCKRLEKNELTQIDNVTVYTFLLPIAQLHPDAANKSRAIWCAPDRAKAWLDWNLNGQLVAMTTNTKCEAPIEKVAAIAETVGAVSTPTMFTSDGKRITGAQPAAYIEEGLRAASKK